jgi:hypothetical protein
MSFKTDPEYDLVLPTMLNKRGRQCGKCGIKFDYGTRQCLLLRFHGLPHGLGTGMLLGTRRRPMGDGGLIASP